MPVANLPRPHAVQLVPVLPDHRAAGQKAQLVALSAYAPAPHPLQLDAPAEAAVWPTGHVGHTSIPALAAKRPATQLVHAVGATPAVGHALPSWHSAQVFPSGVYCPAGQFWSHDLPSLPLVLGARHSKHSVAPPLGAYLPLTQLVHAVSRLEPANWPAAHERHDDAPFAF